MENFLSIYQYIDENYSGWNRDFFKAVIQAYEDEHGEVDWHNKKVDQIDKMFNDIKKELVAFL
jgi:hypothetical protein